MRLYLSVNRKRPNRKTGFIPLTTILLGFCWASSEYCACIVEVYNVSVGDSVEVLVIYE